MNLVAILSAVAVLAATPVSVGLIGNTSFSEQVPVRVPASARVLDDHFGTVPARTGSSAASRKPELGDDHGVDRARGARSAEPRDGGHRGGDDRRSDD
ncbi:MAG: hypothetical protein WB441_12565 [Nocardioidaceae bacterium]